MLAIVILMIFLKNNNVHIERKEYDAKYFQKQSHSELHREYDKLKNELDQLKIDLNVLQHEKETCEKTIALLTKQRNDYS